MNKKTVVITGVSGGMGYAVARKFIREGNRVIGLDLQEPKETKGLHYIQTDLTDMASVEAAFHRVAKMVPRVDILVHMAGIYDLNSLVEMSEEEFIRIFNINLFAVYRVNKAFLPLLRRGSRILITSSELAPLDPLPFTGIYGITKAAVEKYAYSLRMELQLLGIKVILLRPGAVDTGLLKVSTDKLDKFCSDTKLYSCNAERFRKIVNRVEARKVPPERIAETASLAARDRQPKYVYKINRNPLLLLLNLLPDRMQTVIIKEILK